MRKALYMMGILDDSDIEWLATRGRNVRVPQGEVLIHEGEPIDALFIVLDGRLEVRAGTSVIATLLAGEIVGEISFVDSRPPLATVVTATQASVLAIPRDRLRKKLATDAGFSSRFYQAVAVFLADRLRMTTARLGFGSASQDAGTPNDDMAADMMDSVALAAARFDQLLRRMQEAPAGNA